MACAKPHKKKMNKGGNVKPNEFHTNKDIIDKSDNLRDIQYEHTIEFQNKFQDIPVTDILKRAANDKTFKNSKLEQRVDSLDAIYGSKSIPVSTDYITANKVYKDIGVKDGVNLNVIGKNETSLNSFGWRALLQKQLHEDDVPAYKYLENVKDRDTMQPKKKMFIGGAMAIANLGLNAISAVQANIDAKAAAAATRRAMVRDEFSADKEQLKGYNTTGSPTNIFAKGGRFIKGSGLYGKTPNTPAGLAKVSGNIYKAVGPKHEQGGVDISPNVEVEGGEYLKFEKDQVKVLSDDDSFKQIPADGFENSMQTKSVSAAFDDEYAKQEASKGGNYMMAKRKKYEGGGKFNLDNAAPYISNVGNAILTMAKPKVPKPIYQKPISLNTDVNINPQLSEIQRTANTLRRGVRGNFANPITASALEQKVDTNALMQKNQLLGQEEAQESQLQNQQTMVNQQVTAQNQNLANQYRANVAGRTQEQFGELSQNLGNIQDNIIHKQNIDKLGEYQDKQLYIQLLTDPEGKNANAIRAGLFDSILNKLSKADFDKLNLNDNLRTVINSKLIR